MLATLLSRPTAASGRSTKTKAICNRNKGHSDGGMAANFISGFQTAKGAPPAALGSSAMIRPSGHHTEQYMYSNSTTSYSSRSRILRYLCTTSCKSLFAGRKSIFGVY